MSFVRKFFSREKEPKTPSSATLDMTQSMIDFITNDTSPNDSFRSLQLGSNTSFSNLDDERRYKSDKCETEPDLPRKVKLNITSVFNTPKRGSIIDDLYEIVQEQVIDQVGGMLQTSRKPTVSPKLLKSVQQQDFDLYIARLRKVYEVYKKNNAIRARQKQREQVNNAANLIKCYETVPSQYFDEDFMFNFQYLVKDRSVLFKAQEDLSESLDLVDESLYHQITHRFEEFLEILLKLNNLESQIHNSVYSIRFFKNFNNELRQKLSSKVQGVLTLKRRKINIEKTLALIDLINVVKKTLPTLVHLIQKNNFDSAVKLVRTSEETYKTKLKSIKGLKNFNVNFTEARSTLEKLLTSEFENRCINYLSPLLSYGINKETDQTDPIQQKFLSIFGESSKEEGGVYDLSWTLDKISVNPEVEKNIVKIILEYIKIKDFPLTVYKGKLLELMKKFHKKFVTDVTECIDPKTNLKNMPFDLYLKAIVFYFETFQRFLTMHFNLNSRILSALVEFYSNNFVEKGAHNAAGYSYLPTLDTKSMKDLNETVQEFYLTLAMIFKYFNDRLAEVISLRNNENITLKQFGKLVKVFDHITNYFQNDLQLNEKLNAWIVSDKESIRKPLLKLTSSLSDKITISPTQNLFIQLQRDFINQYHKRQLEALKTSLEQEAWARAELSSDLLSSFKVFSQVHGSLENQAKSAEEEEDGNPQEQNLAEKKEGEFVIQNNEVHYNGKKYQITTSFILLLQNINDYVEIGSRFKYIGLDAISKAFETIKTYNSYSMQLVLEAGAITFGKVPRITAKVLGISSISLSLLADLIDPLYQNITKLDLKINQEWLNLEVAKVKHDVTIHINDISAKIRSILKSKLVEQSNELKKLNWGNVQEKITTPTKSTTNILTNTKQMYKQIQAFLLKEQLINIAKAILDDLKILMLPVYENINVENRIAAKRVKDELQHFNDELYQIPIMQEKAVNYSEFEDRIVALLEDKCNHYLEVTSLH